DSRMAMEGSDGMPGACAAMLISRLTVQNGFIAAAAFGGSVALPAAKISVAGEGSGGGLGAGGVAAGGGVTCATTGTGAGAGPGGKGKDFVAATTAGWRCNS